MGLLTALSCAAWVAPGCASRHPRPPSTEPPPASSQVANTTKTDAERESAPHVPDTTTHARPARPPSELRFVSWSLQAGARGSASTSPATRVDLRLTRPALVRRAPALARCIDEVSDAAPRHQAWFLHVHHDGAHLRVHVASAGDPLLPDRTACLEAALAGVVFVDGDGNPLLEHDEASPSLVLGLLVNPVDSALPTVGPSGPRGHHDEYFMNDDGRCFERVRPPCAPRKSCMAPHDVEVSCSSDLGIAAPNSTPASELMLVADVVDFEGHPRRLVATRWNELCAIEVREPPRPTPVAEAQLPSVEFEITRAGPIPCRAMHELAALARQVNDAARRRSKPRSAPPRDETTSSGETQAQGTLPTAIAIRLHRLEPSWSSIRVIVDLDALPEPPPDTWLELRAKLEGLIERWTLPSPLGAERAL